MASIRSFFTALFIVARISPMYFHRSMKQRKNLALRFLCFVLFVLFVLLFLMMAMLRTAAVADATNRDLMNSIEVFHNPIEIWWEEWNPIYAQSLERCVADAWCFAVYHSTAPHSLSEQYIRPIWFVMVHVNKKLKPTTKVEKCLAVFRRLQSRHKIA